jgi:hypothetical protein
VNVTRWQDGSKILAQWLAPIKEGAESAVSAPDGKNHIRKRFTIGY